MKKFLVVLFSVLALSACAGNYLNGKIVNIESGELLPMKIQTSYGQGNMEAYNSTTNEKFYGTYTALSEGSYGMATNFATGQMVVVSSRSRNANAKALLTGDKGTTLLVFMQIEKGFRPIGFGEATDNKGNKYHVEF